MTPAIENEPDAMIQNRPPTRKIKLALHQPRQPVIGGPAVQKETVLGQALAPSGQVAGHQAALAEGQMDGVQLVAAVATVLLTLAGHAVHQRFLGAVVEGVDRGSSKALEARVAGAKDRVIGPGKNA